ncbi:MAG: fimbria/pilus outer membrane usher protein [Porticoccaceae bacterium]
MILALILPPAAATATSAPSEAVRAVRLGHWPDRVRLVLETDASLPFRVLSNPGDRELRLVLDNVAAQSLAGALARALPADGALIRGHAVDGDDTAPRLTLHFNGPVTANLFNLKPDHGLGHRLVVDLFPTAPAAGPGQAPAAPRELALPRHDENILDGGEGATVAPALEELWLDARLNNQRERTTVLALRRGADEVLLGEEDLRNWRINPPQGGALEHGGERFHPLSTLGVEARLDPRRLTLDLDAPANLFGATRLDGPRRDPLPLAPSPLGAFANYDLSATRGDDGEVRAAGLFELGVFNGWGSGTANLLARRDPDGRERELVRLDTQWRRDDPERMRTLVVGDTTNRGTGWSGGVRFGGIQWGTNFSTQPEFLTLPLLSMGGEAALPSTLDLYVNDALRLRREVPPGPFTIDEIPTVTGQGQTRLVVRDILGREQVITQDFYASQRLLRAGLREYAVELGAIRENYGRASFDYGRPLAAATWRGGISDRLTLEAHGQLLGEDGESGEDSAGTQATAGLGASWLLPAGGVLYGSLAASEGDPGRGELFAFGAQRQGRRLSAGFDTQLASAGFARAGMLAGDALPAHQSRLYASLAGIGRGALSLGYTVQNHRQREDVEFTNLGYSIAVGTIGYLSLTALHFLDSNDTTLRAHFTLPLDREGTTASLAATHRDGGSGATARVQRSLPVGTGLGYSLEASGGDSDQQRASVAYQNDRGSWSLEGSRFNGQTATRANARGGIALLGGLFASRAIDDSFAVVRVPGFPGVRVYADNQPVARTNGDGVALVPRLRAYQRNRLRIDQADLPLDANVGGLERDVAPYHRSGVTLEFPVTRSRNALFRLELDNGDPLPTGAVVVATDGTLFPVGLRGEVFATDLEPVNRLEARWRGQRCPFTLRVPDSDEPLVELGAVACGGVRP